MSGGDVTENTLKLIDHVQHLIELCLQLYMSNDEAVSTISEKTKGVVKPEFVDLVWQRLRAENEDFFKAYDMRLAAKEQVLELNKLLEEQAELMHKPTRVASMARGKHKAPVHDKNIGVGLNPQNMQQQPLVPFTNGGFRVGSGSSLYPTMQTPIDTSVHATRVDLFTQQPNVGSMGMMIPGITGPTIGNPSGPSSGNVEYNLKIPSQKVLDPGISSFGSLGQMPRSLSMLDLSADFSVDDLADISAFLTTDGSELDLDLDMLECNGSGQHQDPTRTMQDTSFLK